MRKKSDPASIRCAALFENIMFTLRFSLNLAISRRFFSRYESPVPTMTNCSLFCLRILSSTGRRASKPFWLARRLIIAKTGTLGAMGRLNSFWISAFSFAFPERFFIVK